MRRICVERPRCEHTVLAWAKYEAERDAYHAVHGYGRGADYPAAPETKGYCDDCWRGLCASREPWPAAVWDHLNASAAHDAGRGTLPLRPYRPPATLQPRRAKPDTLRARVAAAYTGPEGERGIGRACGAYRIEATDGCAALLVRGAGERQGANLLSPNYDRAWVDLPPAFHTALARVRLLSHERTSCVQVSVEGETVRLYAQSFDYGEAWESVPIVARQGEAVTPYVVGLSARYLDPLCGAWPLRWYLQTARAPGTYPQAFAPAGADWLGLIMPMRV